MFAAIYNGSQLSVSTKRIKFLGNIRRFSYFGLDNDFSEHRHLEAKAKKNTLDFIILKFIAL